ncbi:hypothetical protein AaE_005316 [Aphanomyces astaci]|uniref:GAG-pre-integrase domain-containing protein n=1 Tax=Aphanomyces astaci TaxID=112090 RepID=A0A6A5APD2_APHAT|nr:hypothetical protein AaE_005316 [Aphanomyces astaci]
MGRFRVKNPNGLTCVFTNVLYVPTLCHTLVSVPTLTSKERVTVQFKGKTCSIKVGDRVSAEAKLNDRMYQLTGKIEAAPDDIACLATDGATWHQRLGHPYTASTKEIIASTKDGPTQAMEPQKCDDCTRGKMIHVSPPKVGTRNWKVDQCIHSDLWGPTR